MNLDIYKKENPSVNNFNNNRKYSTLISRKVNKPFQSVLIRNFSTSSLFKNNSNNNNNLKLKSVPKNLEKTKLNYNKNNFIVLDKIRELTENKDYNPKEVQLKIENFWSDIIKENYLENNYKPIQDLQPKIYDIFLFSNVKILEKVFPDLYLFLDDIRIFLMTYSVITTYFRRTSRTNISVFVANQILFFIYKNYFNPIVSKGVEHVRKSKKFFIRFK